MPRAARSRAAFTLLELIVSLTIASLLVVVGAGALRSGLALSGRGAEGIAQMMRDDAAHEFFWRQLAAARCTKLGTIYGFIGERDSLMLVSIVSFTRGSDYGLVAAYYKVESDPDGGNCLSYRERRILNKKDWESIDEQGPEPFFDDIKPVRLFRQCDEIEFGYLAPAEGETDSGEWKNTWKETDKPKSKMPRAVRLRLEAEGAEREILAPIVVSCLSSSSGR